MADIPNLKSKLARASMITLPMALIEMSQHVTGIPDFTHKQITAWGWIMAVATTWVVFEAGLPLLVRGWKSFATRKLNMFSLIAPGILITYFYSLLALVVPDAFPESMRHAHGVPLYFESAAMITTLVLLGQYLENRAEKKTGSALEALARLAPARTCVIRNGSQQWISIDELQVSDHVQLRSGDHVPSDGVIHSGSVMVDESMMTGESIPILKSEYSEIIGGTVVKEGAAMMSVTRVGSETVLSKIVAMVKTAQESKAPIQRVADRVTGKLVPFVLITAIATMLIWWKLGPSPALWHGMIHAVTVLMITCPCALGLATPLSIVTGIGRGALDGILIRDAASLEKLASVDVLLVDKTGTLTTGQPRLQSCVPRIEGNETWLLRMAGALEAFSHHPLALAVVKGARDWGITPPPAFNVFTETGAGLGGDVEGHRVLVGNLNWMDKHEVAGVDELDFLREKYEREGNTVIFVSVDGNCQGLLVVADELKPHAREAVKLLKERGIRILILTGDTPLVAQSVAKQLRLDDVIASLRPEEKSAQASAYQKAGHVVGMAGDGINDGPALATADVGIAIGTATSVAVSSGQINLLSGDLMGLVHAVDLSRAVMRNIHQNLFWAFAYNIVMIPVAAGALFPWTGVMLTPMLASAAMSASSITVILNALRLRRLRFTRL
ncbi:MAG TPA: copper-translocating P-type ATPase [Kiritimatiellia bacterium]|nr:copper-translocating P-type ATPase [Kiritimatiellia bacterium]